MRKIRWGVLGAARIGINKVIPAMQRGEHCEVVAIASRDLSKARTAAASLGIARAYGSYEELLADPEVDAIYNPLPNHLHVPWSLKALQAGKHVLCEKPLALKTADAQKLAAAGKKYPNLKLMEAFMYRFHPQWVLALQLLREGQIGEVRTIHTHFSYYNIDPNNIRNIAGIGGGGLMDIGCYCISFARTVFGREPSRVFGIVEYDPEFKTDRLSSGILDFGSGTGTFTCATRLAPYQRANILGTEGRIEIEIPVNIPSDKPARMWLQRGSQVEEMVLDACDQYTRQGDAFSLAILDDTPVPTPIQDGVANMRVLEAVVASGKSGKWEILKLKAKSGKRIVKSVKRGTKNIKRKN
jgi:predicted dehydrogenase